MDLNLTSPSSPGHKLQTSMPFFAKHIGNRPNILQRSEKNGPQISYVEMHPTTLGNTNTRAAPTKVHLFSDVLEHT